MAEIYERQVRVQPNMPQKIAAVQQTNFITPALENLGKVVKEYGERKQKIDDTIIAASMDAVKKQGMFDIANAKSATSDYTQTGIDAFQAYDEEFNKFDEQTRARYLEKHPKDRDIYGIDVQTKVTEKTRAEVVNRFNNYIPELASNVVLGNVSHETALQEVRVAIGQFATPEQFENMVFRLNSQIDHFNVNAAIVSGDLGLAEAIIESADVSNTLSPVERIQYAEQIQNKLEKWAKDMESAQEKALSDAEKLQVDLIADIYDNKLRMNDPKAAEDFKNSIYVRAKTPDYDATAIKTQVVAKAMKEMDSRYNMFPMRGMYAADLNGKATAMLMRYEESLTGPEKFAVFGEIDELSKSQEMERVNPDLHKKLVDAKLAMRHSIRSIQAPSDAALKATQSTFSFGNFTTREELIPDAKLSAALDFYYDTSKPYYDLEQAFVDAEQRAKKYLFSDGDKLVRGSKGSMLVRTMLALSDTADKTRAERYGLYASRDDITDTFLDRIGDLQRDRTAGEQADAEWIDGLIDSVFTTLGYKPNVATNDQKAAKLILSQALYGTKQSSPDALTRWVNEPASSAGSQGSLVVPEKPVMDLWSK